MQTWNGILYTSSVQKIPEVIFWNLLVVEKTMNNFKFKPPSLPLKTKELTIQFWVPEQRSQ